MYLGVRVIRIGKKVFKCQSLVFAEYVMLILGWLFFSFNIVFFVVMLIFGFFVLLYSV